MSLGVGSFLSLAEMRRVLIPILDVLVVGGFANAVAIRRSPSRVMGKGA